MTEKLFQRTNSLAPDYQTSLSYEKQLQNAVRDRRAHFLTLCECLQKSCLFSWLCCKKPPTFCHFCCKDDWYEQKRKLFTIHNTALERLEIELDVVQFIKHIRLTRFLTTMLLNKTQKPLFKLFDKYHINSKQVGNGVDVFEEEVDMLCDEGFRPDLDKIDQLIYESIFPDSSGFDQGSR